MTDLATFQLPDEVVGNVGDIELACRMIDSWRRDGIFQIDARAYGGATAAAFGAAKRFFAEPTAYKLGYVSDQTYAGYIAYGAEITGGKADYSEVYTVTKDLPTTDPRVVAGWPCHGPAPWPDDEYARAMQYLMGMLQGIGDRLLRLAALALGLDSIDALRNVARDGWHHLRALRFPEATPENGGHGIAAHTDYGLLVIVVQDAVGGLYVRPPVAGEKRPRNWLEDESAAGMFENEEPWNFVKPIPEVFTVFPGDVFQFLTGGDLLATPHKVKLADRERYSLAYFHEPNFNACIRPGLRRDGGEEDEFIHYGTHFTNMAIRSYGDRITTKRIFAENRLATLAALRVASALA